MLSWFKRVKAAPPFPGPDFSAVDSRAKADALIRAGELIKIQLLPRAFGGDTQDHNRVFAPSFVSDLKTAIDNDTIQRLVDQGVVQSYSASPRYHGQSFVPTAIDITASPANFSALLKIWGPPLNEAA